MTPASTRPWAARPDLPSVPRRPTPAVDPDYAALMGPEDGLRVLWLGHASCLMRIGRHTVLTDPVAGRVFPAIRRRVRRVLDPAALAGLDRVLVSHNHYDHLDVPTLRRVVPKAGGLVTPQGHHPLLARRRLRGRELAWWEADDAEGMRVTAVPAQHWSRRGAADTNRAHWCGFVIESGGFRAYFAGDTAWGPHYRAIAAKFPGGFDVAMLPIGAYHPAFMFSRQHQNPAEALRAAQILGARHTIAIHWGTYRLTLERLDEPPRWAAQAWERAHAGGDRSAGDLVVLPVGGTWTAPAST